VGWQKQNGRIGQWRLRPAEEAEMRYVHTIGKRNVILVLKSALGLGWWDEVPRT